METEPIRLLLIALVGAIIISLGAYQIMVFGEAAKNAHIKKSIDEIASRMQLIKESGDVGSFSSVSIIAPARIEIYSDSLQSNGFSAKTPRIKNYSGFPLEPGAYTIQVIYKQGKLKNYTIIFE